MSRDGASPLASARPRVHVAPLGRVASWGVVGNLAYAGCQWGMLVVLAKLGSAEMLGQLALGFAITAPVFLLTSLSLRAVLVTDATVQIPAGGLGLQVLSDDGVRVWVDGALVIDQWSIHDTRVDRATLAAGSRKLRIEYFDAAGSAELQVSFVRRPEPRNP